MVFVKEFIITHNLKNFDTIHPEKELGLQNLLKKGLSKGV
jgi:hypothetical protein